MGVTILLYPGVGILTFFNKASLLGLLCVGIMVFIIGFNRHDSKKVLGRSLLVFGIALFGIIILSISLHFFIKTGTPKLDEYANNHYENPLGMYIVNVIRKTLNSESKTGLFLDGTVKNAYDHLSSSRLGIWYIGVKQINFFGNSDTAVTVPNGEFYAHTHNTYLDIFLRFGWIGGCIIILWFFVCFCTLCIMKTWSNITDECEKIF